MIHMSCTRAFLIFNCLIIPYYILCFELARKIDIVFTYNFVLRSRYPARRHSDRREVEIFQKDCGRSRGLRGDLSQVCNHQHHGVLSQPGGSD